MLDKLACHLDKNKAQLLKNNLQPIPDWCGSVGWVSSPKQKGPQFNSWSGHMPGFQARSLTGGMQEATIDDVSLPLFLLLFPSL